MPFRANDLLAELPRLRRYARVLTGDFEAADRLVEATLLRLRHESAETRSPPNHLALLALLRTVNAEKASSDVDSTLRAQRSSPLAKWVQGPTATAKSIPGRSIEMLAKLGELPLEQREVLVLVAVEQLPYGDIATLLAIPVATVVSRLSQARAALRAASAESRSAPNNAV